MKSTIVRFFGFLVTLAVSAVVAVHLSLFIEQDNCLDGGGAYVASTGACVVPAGVGHVAQLSAPSTYVFWSLFLVLVFVPGWLSGWLFRLLLHWIKSSVAQRR